MAIGIFKTCENGHEYLYNDGISVVTTCCYCDAEKLWGKETADRMYAQRNKYRQ